LRGNEAVGRVCRIARTHEKVVEVGVGVAGDVVEAGEVEVGRVVLPVGPEALNVADGRLGAEGRVANVLGKREKTMSLGNTKIL
jgi:hypothetical protein